MSEHKKPNELLLIASTAEALDNVRGYRLRGATDLATFFKHLKLRQLLKRRLMYSDRYLPRQFPNLEVSVAHSVSRIPPLAPRIAHHSSSSISAGIRSARLPYCNESNARTCVEAASNSEISFCDLPRKNA